MRSKNAIRNLGFYLIYEIMVFALGIIFPRYIILVYGSEINGLASTITRLLSLINLIQAGAVGSAIFQMYKPVAENDYETQSAILYSSKKFYKKFTVIYLLLAAVVGVAYSFYLRNDTLKFWEILISFGVFALNSSFTLFFNSKCDIYLSPHQKKYLMTISSIAGMIVHYMLLVVVLLLRLHFIFIYLSILAGGIVTAILNLVFYGKYAKNKIKKEPIDKNYKIPSRNFLMMSSIGSEAVTASPAVIITTFIGLASSSVFSIYSMVFTSMKTLLSSVQLSFSAIFGNLVKTSDDKHIFQVYDTIVYITMGLGTVLSFCVGFLTIPFVKKYTSGITDIEYVYPLLAVFVTAYVCIFTFRTSFSYVATVYGLFKKTCYIILIFGGLGIIISTVLAILFGLPYVMVGLLFNQLGCSIATLVVIKKDVPWFKFGKLFLRTGILLVMSSLSVVLYFVLTPITESWGEWIKYGVICFAIAFVIWSVYSAIFEIKNIKYIFSYIKTILKRKMKKEQKNVDSSSET